MAKKPAASKAIVARKKPGPPSSYSDKIANEICARLANGESMRQICRDDNLPDRMTVERWAEERPELAANIARARSSQADCLLDDMAEIETDILASKIDPNAARVAMWSKQWRASKMAPKKYGDKMQAEISGRDGGPIETRELSALEAARVIMFALSKGAREKDKG